MGSKGGVWCGDVVDTGRNRVTADMSHVYFYSASLRPRCRNHSQVVPSCQKLKHQKSSFEKDRILKKKSKTKITHSLAEYN